MFGADDKLSRAASAVWEIESHSWMDFAMDGSGELGDRIAKHHNDCKLAAVRAAGFAPAEYNNALRDRLVNEDGTMSYRVHQLLCTLEVEDEVEYHLNHTYVVTCGELSSLAYLTGGDQS